MDKIAVRLNTKELQMMIEGLKQLKGTVVYEPDVRRVKKLIGGLEQSLIINSDGEIKWRSNRL